MNAVATSHTRSPLQTARLSAEGGFTMILLTAVATFACWLIATRSLDTGTDTQVYANFFSNLANRPIETRLEPGFVYISMFAHGLGLGIAGYQAVLFGLLLVTVLISTRAFYQFLGATTGYITFLSAAAMLLLLSPVFVNSSINAVRQGLAALLVFTALMAFEQRQWWRFCMYALTAALLHFSSALYVAFAPMLLLGYRRLRWVAVSAFLVYVSGASMYLVHSASPALYSIAMEHAANPNYRSGVRMDFALFSMAWYALPFLAAPLVQEPHRARLKESTSLYLVMLLPFFMIGWGFFSNRYLLPAWQAASLILAAMLSLSRSRLLRSPALIDVGLILSAGIFYYYVHTGIVI
jgi:hypothetical protein